SPACAHLTGVSISRQARGDELATTAMTAVRRIARAGGHPLPANVPPASHGWTPAPGSCAASGARDMDVALVGALFVGTLALASLALELWRRRRRGRPA